jgi:hypothetical protein
VQDQVMMDSSTMRDIIAPAAKMAAQNKGQVRGAKGQNKGQVRGGMGGFEWRHVWALLGWVMARAV